ncbi:MAG TPA: tetratricopeptide repeat protein, partial [Chroococcales cyanobacterium]
QYDLTARYASSALIWNMQCMPLTYLPFRQSFQIYLNLLMVEGRSVELEVLSKYAWAMNEPQKKDDASAPKNWVIANNLAVAYLGQSRYEEASGILKEMLARTTQKGARLYLLNNLGLCYTKLKDFDNAGRCIKEGMALNGGKKENAIGYRLIFVNGLLEYERGNYDLADACVTEAQQLAAKMREPIEMQGGIEQVLSKIRLKQGRLDEAELHCRNAFSAFESAPSPSYFALSMCFLTFAEISAAQGNQARCEEYITRARLAREAGIDREAATMASISQRLNSNKRILVGTQLIENATRNPLLERTVH